MKKHLYLLLCLFIFSFKASAQFNPDNTFGHPPSTSITYTDPATIPGNSTANWTITNGTITAQTGTTVTVKWNDDYNSSTGTLTHTIKVGTDPAQSTTVTYKIKALKNFTPNNIGGPATVTYCSTATVFYSIPAMKYNYDGGAVSVDGYEWTIPNGWKYPDGVVSNGTTARNIPGVNNGLNLTPDGCHAGTIKVRGYTISGSSYVSYSNFSQWDIVLLPNFIIDGPGQVVCGSTAPLTYTIANASCATVVNWVYPAGWSGPATGSTVTVTPTATNMGTQNITANVTMCGGVVKSKSYPVETILYAVKPTIAGSSTVCSGANQTYSIANPAAGSVVWSVTGTGATILGSNTNPTVTLQFASNGAVTLGATITSPCTDKNNNSTIVLDNIPICTGVPYPNPSTTGAVTICTQGLAGRLNVVTNNACATDYIAYSNSTAIEPNHPNPDYNSAYTVASGDHRAYQYIIGGAGSSKILTSDAAPGTYQLALYAINACGYSGRSNVSVTIKTCGGRDRESSFTVFPNPSSSKLNVTFTPNDAATDSAKTVTTASTAKESNSYFVELLNEKGAVVAKGWTKADGKLSLDVSQLPKKIYYVHIHYGDEVIRKQFIIN